MEETPKDKRQRTARERDVLAGMLACGLASLDSMGLLDAWPEEVIVDVRLFRYKQAEAKAAWEEEKEAEAEWDTVLTEMF